MLRLGGSLELIPPCPRGLSSGEATVVISVLTVEPGEPGSMEGINTLNEKPLRVKNAGRVGSRCICAGGAWWAVEG